jgi:hypothetical protein
MSYSEKMIHFFGRADVMNAVRRGDRQTYHRLLLEHLSR